MQAAQDASKQGEVQTLLRLTFAAALLYTAGTCFQIYLSMYAWSQYRRTSPAKQEPRRLYVRLMLVISVLSILAYVLSILDNAFFLSTYVPIFTVGAPTTAPRWSMYAFPLVVGSIHTIGDGLLAWRCYVIWNGKPWVRWIPVVPYILSLATAVPHVMTAGPLFHTHETIPENYRYQTLYFFGSVGVNIVATTLICVRLIGMKLEMRRAEHDAEVAHFHAAIPYLKISMVLVESALPFTLFGLSVAILSIFLGRYGQTKPLLLGAFSFMKVLWTTACGLAPQLIIYHVTIGSSWIRNPTEEEDIISQSLRFTEGRHQSSTNGHVGDGGHTAQAASWRSGANV